MKAWIRQWLGIATPSAPDREIDELVAKVIEKLAAAQSAHISDLRVLLDKASDREAQLADMVKMVMEERFHRPIPSAPTSRPSVPGLSPEQLQDVTVFDEKADGDLVKEQIETQRKLQQGLDQLLSEHENAHAEEPEAIEA